MNREHIRAVRDALHVLAETGKSPVAGVSGFYMDRLAPNPDCGSACCILGWSSMIEGLNPEDLSWREDERRLGLSNAQIVALCFPQETAAMATRDPRHGVAMLDWLLAQPDDVPPEAIAKKWAEVVA